MELQTKDKLRLNEKLIRLVWVEVVQLMASVISKKVARFLALGEEIACLGN